MSPALRNVLLGAAGFILGGAIGVFGLVQPDPGGLSVITMVIGALITALTGVYLFVAAWRGAVEAYRSGRTGRSAGIALAGGLMILIAAGALSVAAILALLFVGG